jgi:hypothetical protein
MARPRSKNSKTSLNNMGLTPDEDRVIEALMVAMDKSCQRLQRVAMRELIKKEQHRVPKEIRIDYSKALQS